MYVWIHLEILHVRNWNKKIRHRAVNAQSVSDSTCYRGSEHCRSIYPANMKCEHLCSSLSIVHRVIFVVVSPSLVTSFSFVICRTIGLSLRSSLKMINPASLVCPPTLLAHLSAWPVLRWEHLLLSITAPYNFISFNRGHSIFTFSFKGVKWFYPGIFTK